MRPLKIKITAFGPYRTTETVDFSELKGNTLFVISGNTGAGKTTIFDAISFALYGEASGEDRQDIKLMRSHFADDDTHTSVELTFELRGKIYRIFRQLAHVKEENKVATGNKYEFFEMKDGQEVPCVDRQMVTEINKKVEELLGLTKAQFSQIVMLPQGEFRKLLTSETENKEEILRRIFKTEPYKWLNEKLNTKRREVEGFFERERQSRDTYISNISASLPEREDSLLYSVLGQDHYNVNQVLNGLQKEAEFYEKEFEKSHEQYQQHVSAYDQKLSEFHKVKITNETFLELESKRDQFIQLTKDIPNIDQQKVILERAQQASRITPYDQQVKDWRKDELKRKAIVDQAKLDAQKAKELYQKAKESYDKESKNELQRDQVKRNIDRLEQLLPIVKEIDDKQKEIAVTEKTMHQLAKQLNVINDQITSDKQLRYQLVEDVRSIEEAVLAMSKKKELLQELRQISRVLRDYLKIFDEKKRLQQDVQSKETNWKKAKNEYQLLERQWLEGQAGLIATELHAGEPCPVCGSLEHPKRALKHESVPTKEALDLAKQERDLTETAYRDVLTIFQSTNRSLQEKYHEIENDRLDPQSASKVYEDNVNRGKQLKLEVEQLEKKQDRLIRLRKDIETIEKRIDQVTVERDKVESFYQKKKTSLETQQALYNNNLKDIPNDIRTLSSLEQRIADVKKTKEKLEMAWKQAQELLTASQENDTKMASHLENSEQQYLETVERRKKAEQTFELMCDKVGFLTMEAYSEAIKTEEEQKAIQKSIASFNTQYETVKQRIDDLETQLKGKEKMDLQLLESELNQLKGKRDLVEETVRKSKDYHNACHRLNQLIQSTHSKVEKQEKQLEMVTELYDIVRGQNSKKISFERFLQIEFLEQIVHAANSRLRHLSSGQYQLFRSERQESFGKQSGLGLDVYDAYTGQSRDVKTLSGGEKFHASLCLALGMADVIQSFQGGVSIDTMFIDEGFGSLDEESLTKAIDALIELQKTGRMIGVISHVHELKQTIPAILEVQKTREGYSKTRFILK